MNRHADDMLAALQNAGVKITAQRRAIVERFAGDPTHPTAQDIYRTLRAKRADISFATVYNTLAKLRECGLCSDMTVGGAATRFDPNVARHDHTVCLACGNVRDVPSRRGRQPALADFEVHTVESVYRGVCGRCREAGAVT